MLEEFMPKLQEDLKQQEPLGSSADGTPSFSLRLDETTITMSEVAPGFELFATLGELPSELQELFLVKMLRGNLFGQATYGACLGLDETGTKMVLRYTYPIKPTYRDFKERLEDFINIIDFWKAEVDSHQKAPKIA